MDRTKVVVCRSGDFNPGRELIQALEADFPALHVIDLKKEEFAGRAEELHGAEIFIGWPDDEQLLAMPSLRWVQLPSAGANGYTDRPTLREDIQITNSSGVFGVPGAEHAVALLLALTRQLHIHFEQQQSKIWKRNPHCLEVAGSTVGIIGLGDIGKETAKRVKAFGANVLAVKRTVSECPPYVDRLYTIEQIDTVLAESDFIIMALPLTADTEGFLDAERLSRMKKDAILINVGRGPTVDEPALIQALRDGKLAGAGLDVTDIEPLPQDNPLWGQPNVLITSHSVGVSPRKEERRMELFSQNIKKYLAGESLINRVDRRAGY